MALGIHNKMPHDAHIPHILLLKGDYKLRRPGRDIEPWPQSPGLLKRSTVSPES